MRQLPKSLNFQGLAKDLIIRYNSYSIAINICSQNSNLLTFDIVIVRRNDMKTYTIVAGVNGTGKSSLTGVLCTEITNLGKIIDVDKFIANCKVFEE